MILEVKVDTSGEERKVVIEGNMGWLLDSRQFYFLTLVFTQTFALWRPINITYLWLVHFSVCVLHFSEELPQYSPLSQQLY